MQSIFDSKTARFNLLMTLLGMGFSIIVILITVISQRFAGIDVSALGNVAIVANISGGAAAAGATTWRNVRVEHTPVPLSPYSPVSTGQPQP